MAAAIPGARLAVIPGAGHLPPVEQPEATTDSLREFLTFAGVKPSGAAARCILWRQDRQVSAESEVLPNSGSGIAAKQFDPGAPFFLSYELLAMGSGCYLECKRPSSVHEGGSLLYGVTHSSIAHS